MVALCSHALSPFEGSFDPDAVTVLFVGLPTAGVCRVAKALQRGGGARSSPLDARLNVRRSIGLPFPEPLHRPRVDLIVFCVSMRSRRSLVNVVQSLGAVDSEYLLGRSIVLVMSAPPAQRAFPQTDLHVLMQQYAVEVATWDAKSPDSLNHVVDRILTQVGMVTRHQKGCDVSQSPLLLRSFLPLDD